MPYNEANYKVKECNMKRKVWITLLLVLTAALGLVAFASCKPKDNPNPDVGVNDIEGAETGTYYFDASSEEEYDLSLSNGDKFTLLMRDVTRAGEYTLEGEKLTLNFSKPYEQTVEATYRNGEITLTYNDLTMRFIKKVYYTVSFDAHGGSSVPSVSVVNGRTIGKVADPARDGYTFLGWYTDETYNTAFAFDTQPVTGNITLHARWQEGATGMAGFKVNFDLNYANAPTLPAVTTVGGKIVDLKDPSRDGFLFAGWYASQYGEASKLSYLVDENTVISENLTLYATWEAPGSGDKLHMPRVSVSEQGLSWNASGANSYNVSVKGPKGFTEINQSTTSTNFPVDFATAPAGEYTITVQGTASNTANNSAVVELHYKNKALARVSLFEVVSPATLIFNAVDHAREYLISIDCGNKKHVHTAVSNGTSTYYNFANCSMQKGGIKFRVTARANGYVESVSDEFVFEQNLAAVQNVRVDAATQILSWDPVEGATNYILNITCTNSKHDHSRVDVGNATTYNLKECGKGEVKISVTAATKGFNSQDPTEITYNKATIASPTNFRLKGTTLSWDEVEGAASYSLRIAGKTYTSNTNSFDLTTASDVDWSVAKDYQASVQAIEGSDPSSNSLFSDAVDMRYYALATSLEYNRNTLSWRHVIGVTKYEVRLNGASLGVVEDGANFYTVKFAKAGENTLSVRFFDDEQNIEGSEWVSIDVFTYTIEFDTRGGEAVASQYVAYGDKLSLPTTTREGYTFDAWYNVPGGAEKNGAKFDSEYYLEATDIRLFASWDSVQYTVKYVYSNAGEADPNLPQEGTVLYGKKYTLAVPTAPDETVRFLGWFSRADGRGTRYTDENGNSYGTWAIAENGTQVYAYFAKLLSYKFMNDDEGYYSVSAGPGLVLVDHVTIPDKFNGSPVKAIPSFAFLNATTLKSIDIPDSITLLGLDAFKGCTKLESFNIYSAGTTQADIKYRTDDAGVIAEKGELDAWSLYLYPVARSGDYEIPDDITSIAPGFFSGTRITKLIIPAGVTDIEFETFKDCLYLREVVFEDAANEDAKLEIYTNAFSNCPALRKVTFPKQLEVYGANEQGDTENKGNAAVFVNCNRMEEVLMSGTGYHKFAVADGMLAYDGNLIYVPAAKVSENFTVPTGVTGIGDYLFDKAAYPVHVEIPAWATYIGKDAFHNNTALETVTFKASTSGLAAGLTIGEEAFWNCDALTTVTFEDGCGVKVIDTHAFYMSDSIQTLELPNTVEEIHEGAFASCKALSSVSFKSGGTRLEIGMSIFSECPSLAKIALPAHVSKIEYGSFEGAATNEVSVEQGGSHYESENNVLYGLEDGKRVDLVYFPKNIDLSEDTELPDTLEKIGSYVFKGNTHLTKIEIPKSVTWIGVEAFSGASSLSSITFEEDATIEFAAYEEGSAEPGMSYTFRDCISLETLELPAIEKIPGGFLYMSRKSASALREFTIPESVTEIGNQAFYQTSIQSVKIPGKVATIGDSAFYNGNITSLTFDGTASTAPDEEFTPVGDAEGSSALTKIGDSAFFGGRFGRLVLPDSVEEIGASAFAETRITTLALNKSLKTAGNGAFRNCTALTSATISSDVTMSGVFQGCSGLVRMTFAEGVTTVPSNVLNGTNVNTVNVSAKTIKTLDESSLSSQNLTTVIFGNSSNIETIGNYAFQSSGITTLSLPTKVKTIGNSAFSGCSNLSTLTIPNSIESIGNSAFYGCSNLASVKFSGGTKAKSLTLGNYVFQNCTKLTEITLPSSLTEIGTNMFSGSGMVNFNVETGGKGISASNGIIYKDTQKVLVSVLPTKEGSVQIPSSVNYIEDGAFNGSKVTEVTFENGSNTSTKLCIGSQSTIEGEGGAFNGTSYQGAFQGDDTITSITLPSNREVWIGGNAFNGCSSLTTLNLGHTKNIGDSAFSGCTGLTTLTLPETLTSLGNYAFSSCSGLKGELKIPKSLNEVGQNAFNECRGITSLTFESDTQMTKIGDSAFYGMFTAPTTGQQGVEIKLPESITEIGSSAFGSSNFTKITIGKKVKTIGNNAFSSAGVTEVVFEENGALETIGKNAFSSTKITSIEIPATVKEIGDRAFSSCSSLTTVTFKEGSGSETLSLGTIENGNGYVFQSCTKLNTIELPARINNIGPHLFDSCSGLTSVTLPSSISSIASYMFYNCSKLETVDLSSLTSLDSIGTYAFYGCTAITSFTLPASVTTIDNYAFYNFKTNTFELKTNTGGKSSLAKIGNNAFNNAKGIKEFDFSKTEVSELGTGAFMGSDLEKVTFGGSLSSVPANAFQSCTSLATIEWGGDIMRSIENGAFWGCTSLTKLDVPRSIEYIGTVSSSGSYAWNFGSGGRKIGAFECTNISEIDFEGADNLTTIGSGAFYGTQLTGEMKVPSSVTTLAPFAFGGTGIDTLEVPTGLAAVALGSSYVYMTNNTFGLENLKAINVTGEGGNYQSIDGVIYWGTTLMAWPVQKELDEDYATKYFENVTTVYNYAFENAEALEGVDFDLSETSVTKFGEESIAYTGVKTLTLPAASASQHAFRDNEQLTKIEFTGEGTGDETFGMQLFYNCPVLSEIVLPETLKAIPDSLLEGTAVKEITIPASVTSIGQSALSIGTLESVEFEERGDGSELLLSGFVFQDTAITEIELPDGTRPASDTVYGLFMGCTKLTKVTLPEDFPNIGGNMFSGCTALTEIENLDSLQLEFVGKGAFENCASLTTGKGDESTESDVFTLNVERIQSGINESQVDSIWAGSGIKKAKFGALLSYIENYTLQKNDSLEEIDMSAASEVEIKTDILTNCRKLKTIKLPKGEVDWGNTTAQSSIFGNCASLETIELGDDTTTLPDYFTGETQTPKLKEIKVNGSSKLHTIGAYALQGLKGEVGEDGYTVPSSVEIIGDYAFKGANISKITFSSDSKLRDIGAGAFSGMALTEIKIPDSVSIVGASLFQDCVELTKVEGCKGVSAIPNYMFAGCTALTTIPNDLTKNAESVGNGAFQNCAALTTELKFEKADTVGNEAFDGCAKLTKVEMAKASAVPNNCFSGCESLTSVTLNTNLESVGDSAFEGCKVLKSVNIGSAASIGKNAFKNCAALSEISFKSVSTVGESAFEGCTALNKVTIDNNCRIEVIGKRAFFGCSSLATFDVKEGLVSIEEEAFANCSGLKNFKIPKSVSSIGDGAFRGMSGLTCDNENANFKVDNSALYDKEETELISFHGNNGYTMPESVTSIRPYAFAGSGVKKITVNKTITKIGNYAFADATQLSEIKFDEQGALTTLGEETSGGGRDDFYEDMGGGNSKTAGKLFSGCTALTSIEIPASVTTLSSYVFAGSSLSTITFKGTITELPNYAFDGAKFSEFTIPESVTTLGTGCFQNCTALTKISGGKAVTELSDNLFNGCEKLATIENDLWTDLKTLGDNVFKGCKALTGESFKDHLNDATAVIDTGWGYDEISEGVFAGTGITDLTWLPQTWTKIGDNWFEGCTGLTKVQIPAQVESIGSGAFAGINLQEFSVADDSTNTTLLEYSSGVFSGLVANDDEELTLKITVPSGFSTKLGGSMFEEVKAKKFTVELGDHFTDIDYNSFSSTECEEIIIHGNNIKTLGNNAFSNSQNLKTVDLPNSLEEISGFFFQSCGKLEKIKFGGQEPGSNLSFKPGENLKKIAGYAFMGCGSLDDAEIPATVEDLEEYAFLGYGKGAETTTITIKGSVADYEEKHPSYWGTSNIWCCYSATIKDSQGNDITKR